MSRVNNRKQMASTREGSSRSVYLLKGLIIKCGQVSGKPQRTVQGPRAGSRRPVTTPRSEGTWQERDYQNLEGRTGHLESNRELLSWDLGWDTLKRNQENRQLDFSPLRLYSPTRAGPWPEGTGTQCCLPHRSASSRGQGTKKQERDKGLRGHRTPRDDSTRQTCTKVVGSLVNI